MWGSKNLRLNASHHEHKNASPYAFAFKNFGGLQLEIRNEVYVFKPTTLMQVIALALLQEETKNTVL